jgi:hypothetical protein
VVALFAVTGGFKRQYFPVADILVLEMGTVDEQGVFLYGYTATGEFCGDTWHQSIEDAQDQAACEFGYALGEWEEVPSGIDDARDYALAQLY